MALPPGLTPKTVTIGIASFTDGSLASGTVTITAPVNLIHTPTNRPIFSSSMSQQFVDGAATFSLLPTDAPGLNRVDWTYKVNVTVTGALVQPEPIYFTLPTAGPDAVDLDGLVTVPSSAGVPVSVNQVTSVAGLVGDITTDQLTAAGFGGAVASVNGQTGTVQLYPSDVGAQPAGNYPTATDLANGLASKVNSSTYTAGLAGKQDTASLDSAVASKVTAGGSATAAALAVDPALRAAFGSELVAAGAVTATLTGDPKDPDINLFLADGTAL